MYFLKFKYQRVKWQFNHKMKATTITINQQVALPTPHDSSKKYLPRKYIIVII